MRHVNSIVRNVMALYILAGVLFVVCVPVTGLAALWLAKRPAAQANLYSLGQLRGMLLAGACFSMVLALVAVQFRKLIKLAKSCAPRDSKTEDDAHQAPS